MECIFPLVVWDEYEELFRAINVKDGSLTGWFDNCWQAYVWACGIAGIDAGEIVERRCGCRG